jgi:hypothetical protein
MPLWTEFVLVSGRRRQDLAYLYFISLSISSVMCGLARGEGMHNACVCACGCGYARTCASVFRKGYMQQGERPASSLSLVHNRPSQKRCSLLPALSLSNNLMWIV